MEIELRDSGAGIAPELLSRIEEPFFTTKQDGHGLGLAICRSIVRENEGRLTFDSESDRGTHVRILLPAATAAAGEGG